MNRKQLHDNTHLTLEERKIIQAGIESGAAKTSISKTIGKDATTVAKEILKHRELRPRNTFNRPILCANRKTCDIKPCHTKCINFSDPLCIRRDKSPGACNGCTSSKNCPMDKYLYNAEKAHSQYRQDLVDYREGINLTTLERRRIASIIAPLLTHGQSVHQILSAHPEVTQCQKTVYSYIESGVFKEFGIDNFSLKEQVNRKRFKGKLKKRKEPANYTNRKYEDYLRFRAENPDIPVAQMDTVYNSPSGPYLQTLLFESTGFMIGFLHKEKLCENMANGINELQQRLGPMLFSRLCSLILTDRGTEFAKYKLFELDEKGASRLRIFFCDPMQSSQKPHVENNHNYIRDIIPNGYPMDSLCQADIDTMFSHINATPRRSLGDKSPFEVFSFFYGDEAPAQLNITRVPRDDVILKPALLYAKGQKRTG
jgi:IS30 family transposase